MTNIVRSPEEQQRVRDHTSPSYLTKYPHTDMRKWHKLLRRSGLELTAKRVASRTCNGCAVCCELKSIAAVDTPTFQRCQYQTPNDRCAIYAQRPADCLTYSCAYRLGFGPAYAKPSTTGVLVDVRNADPLTLGVHYKGPFDPEPVIEVLAELRAYFFSFKRYKPHVGFADKELAKTENVDGEVIFASYATDRTVERLLRYAAEHGTAPWNESKAAAALWQESNQ